MDTYAEINALIALANTSDDARKIVNEVEDRVYLLTLPEDSYQMKSDNWTLDRWPHQSWHQALLGEIFFPFDIRHSREAPCMLYETKKIRILLTISSRYENPLALYHLEQVSSLYFCKNKRINSAAKEIERITAGRYTPLMKLGLLKGNPYVKAISAWYLSTPEIHHNLEEAIAEGDLRLLPFSKAKRDTAFYRELLDKGYYDYKGALLVITRGMSIEDSIPICLHYADKGMIDGYHLAYLRGDTKKEYLMKALEGSILSAFEDALSVFKLKKLTDIANTLDNEYIYFQLAEHRRGLGKKYKATMCKAGIRGYVYGKADNEEKIVDHLNDLLASIL